MRLLLDYVMAAAVSLLAIGVVAMLQHYVGYLPMLFLPAIVLVESQWGLRAAALSTILCTLGSLLLMGQDPEVAANVHIWANLLLLPGIAASLVYLMEMRRKHQRSEHARGVELSILLQSMPEAVFIFDTDARVVDSNRAAQALADRTRAELCNMRLRQLAHIVQTQENDQPVDYENLAVTRALRGDSIPYERRVLRHPGGGAMVTVLSANPMRDDDGNIIGAVLVVRDITEVTELQTKVADTERHLAIGQMAAGIAHDFNNVLNTISQASAVMEMRRASAEESAAYLRMIQNAVRRGTEIINHVREYIRGGTGEPVAVDVRNVIEEAVELTSPMWREHPRLTIERDLKPCGFVLAIPADLRRVFTNLIINSIQAMPDGGRITVRCGEMNGHKVMGSVSDTGPAIPLDLRKKIFLPYFTTKPQGTGLGLSGAQRIVQSLGGSISFTNEAGKGTTFAIELPRAEKVTRDSGVKKEGEDGGRMAA